jgi:dTDP-4-dehydrorhamnose reductase
MMLITGGSGKLGRELVKLFPESLHPTHPELDLTEGAAVDAYIRDNKPDTVIHVAAWTNVRGCEMDRERALDNNVVATENLVESLQRHVYNCYTVYMSTACVFRGDKGDYTEKDLPYPDNFYGLTKLLGEYAVKRMKNHLILRANFVPREPWKYEKAYIDRYGTYLFTDTLAAAIKEVMSYAKVGILHLVGKEKISMFKLAKITTPNIKPLTMKETHGHLPLPRDMSLRSVRIEPYDLRQ